MKTKEEILNENGCIDIPFDQYVTVYYPAILNAMEEYAQQQLKNCNLQNVIKSVCKHKNKTWNADAGCMVCDECNEKC